MLAAILGLSGPILTEAERRLFAAADPAGYILFARNIVDKDQLRALTDALRGLSGRADLPILVDQEGGRVARLRPPVWQAFPAAARFGTLYEVAPISALAAARANGEAIAITLREVGINVACAPVLDLAHEGAHDIIGDRAFGADPMRVAALGGAMLDGLAAGGVCGVIKHLPGHGRARADSHSELPVVEATAEDLAADLAPFRALRHAPMAMIGHLLFPVWDADRPASVSPAIVGDIVRRAIGYDGLLLSDDIAMSALTGTPGERTRAVLAAGCDLALHCSGEIAEGEAVAEAAGEIPPGARARLDRAMASVAGGRSGGALRALTAKRDALLAYAPADS